MLTVLGADVDAGSAEQLQLHLLLHPKQVGANITKCQDTGILK